MFEVNVLTNLRCMVRGIKLRVKFVGLWVSGGGWRVEGDVRGELPLVGIGSRVTSGWGFGHGIWGQGLRVEG